MNQNTQKIAWALFAISLLPLAGCEKNSGPIAASRPVASDSTIPEDIAISIKLKELLAVHPVLKDFQISVFTTQGDVRLIGTLDNEAQIDAVITMAKNMQEVASVTNDLVLADAQAGKY